MMDAHQSTSDRKHKVSQESFAAFLRLLSPDADEAGRLYTRLHSKLIGFFNMKGISDGAGAADETIDRAVSKIAAGATVPDVEKYCRGIARNVALEILRRERRDTSAFEEFTDSLARSSCDYVERIYEVLRPCFEQLAAEEQRLLLAYCDNIKGRARAEHRRKLALSMKVSVVALRVRVTRLREVLTNCIRGRLDRV